MPTLETWTPNAERHLEKVNTLLPVATPMGAYCLGLLSIFVFRHGVDIPDVILDGAVKITSFAQALEYAEAVWELRDENEDSIVARMKERG